MYFRGLIAALASAVLLAGTAQAQAPAPAFLYKMPQLAPAHSAKIHVRVDAMKYDHVIPSEYTFCTADGHGGTTAAANKNPSISWSKGPAATKSYAVVVYDTDSPAEHRELMNQKGATLTKAVKRKIFFHMVLVDIPANVMTVPEGAASNERLLHGKPASAIKVGVPAANSYTPAFAANDAMKGTYYGYDGPCSPWNDENAHHYHFTVYALSVPSLGLSGEFSAEAAVAAMKGKVLAQGQFLGVYSTNPAVMAKLKK
ncbi:MAG: YbhB/YbcL family Raf kinase inhibitor-like protein [Alphaproteobacteria bacterium]|nr:YbhB/YbcL family Raf kinase inhibitor-like protein [Alphaproteobacteria bacterium]